MEAKSMGHMKKSWISTFKQVLLANNTLSGQYQFHETFSIPTKRNPILPASQAVFLRNIYFMATAVFKPQPTPTL